jgi:hypothetical protein
LKINASWHFNQDSGFESVGGWGWWISLAAAADLHEFLDASFISTKLVCNSQVIYGSFA